MPTSVIEPPGPDMLAETAFRQLWMGCGWSILSILSERRMTPSYSVLQGLLWGLTAMLIMIKASWPALMLLYILSFDIALSKRGPCSRRKRAWRCSTGRRSPTTHKRCNQPPRGHFRPVISFSTINRLLVQSRHASFLAFSLFTGISVLPDFGSHAPSTLGLRPGDPMLRLGVNASEYVGRFADC